MYTVAIFDQELNLTRIARSRDQVGEFPHVFWQDQQTTITDEQLPYISLNCVVDLLSL